MGGRIGARAHRYRADQFAVHRHIENRLATISGRPSYTGQAATGSRPGAACLSETTGTCFTAMRCNDGPGQWVVNARFGFRSDAQNLGGGPARLRFDVFNGELATSERSGLVEHDRSRGCKVG